MGTGTIFMIQDGKLVEMTETAYESEDLFQELLASYPKLIPGDQIDSENPRRWLFVEREVGVPGEAEGYDRWSLDHLFLDQDAVPTLIEVKRSSDTRLRREVVGQMLDYAANAVVYWPVEKIRQGFESRCVSEVKDPDEVLQAFLGERDPDEFWKMVKTNLQAGRVRLLFVADVIPDELRRIVEFLNEQMDPAEVLAVRVRRFANDTVQTLVPQVIGATAQAQAKKTGRTSRRWDEESFFQHLKTNVGAESVAVAKRYIDWARQHLPRMAFGRGAVTGAMTGVLDLEGNRHYPVWLFSDGVFQIQFQRMADHAPFDSVELRDTMLEKVNKIPGVDLPPDAIDKYPGIRMDVLAKGKAMDQFMAVMEWYVFQVRGVEDSA